MRHSTSGNASLRWLAEAQIAKFHEEQTDCFRIAVSPDAFVDWWGGRVVLSTRSDTMPASLEREILTHPAIAAGARAIFLRKLRANPGPEDVPQLLAGQADHTAFVVHERRTKFLVHPSHGYTAGLFPDQRDNRAKLRELIRQRSGSANLLNLFAHTCAFSVAAAEVGARTTSVDVSRRFLEWGRQNFEVNQISCEGHRFVREDALLYLHRLSRRGERFDFIILDPPTFSRNQRGRIFRMSRDFPELLHAAIACAAPKAVLLLSGNWQGLSFRQFAKWVQEECKAAALEPGVVPVDYVGSPCSSTAWVFLP